jgi:hypothetical protein
LLEQLRQQPQQKRSIKLWLPHQAPRHQWTCPGLVPVT